MVCSFFYRTIPVLIFMCIYWAYCKITGKDQEPQVEENELVKGETKEAKTSNCPYHIFMAMIGFPVKPKAKKEDGSEKSESEDVAKSVKVE